jgi:GNAT superfamily N-acetyltransferase
MASSIQFAETDAAIRRCFPTMQVLRPHLTDPDAFVAQVRRQQSSGYRLVCLEDGDAVRSVAGFRVQEYLAWGRVLYIDDLVTAPDARKRGYGAALLRRLIDHARSLACDAVHLDSGYQRHDAHRLYLRMGFDLSSHHLALRLALPE